MKVHDALGLVIDFGMLLIALLTLIIAIIVVIIQHTKK
ncbi:putative holin-like toxin [Paenibacillus sp. SC116]|nr:putative holin-like toxin [Paenibacillus sp. SC116]MCR8846342.1 putative holin-like toxin [Paenibacillus sp. SC116]